MMKMSKFASNLLFNFFIAFGVIVGASLCGAFVAFIAGQPTMKTMLDFAQKMKIWAIVVALGGTFSSFKILELGLLEGELGAVTKQILYIISAFAGAQAGHLIIYLIGKWETL
jgi:membrane protein DedA with SNARE-associated domain